MEEVVNNSVSSEQEIELMQQPVKMCLHSTFNQDRLFWLLQISSSQLHKQFKEHSLMQVVGKVMKINSNSSEKVIA